MRTDGTFLEAIRISRPSGIPSPFSLEGTCRITKFGKGTLQGSSP